VIYRGRAPDTLVRPDPATPRPQLTPRVKNGVPALPITTPKVTRRERKLRSCATHSSAHRLAVLAAPREFQAIAPATGWTWRADEVRVFVFNGGFFVEASAMELKRYRASTASDGEPLEARLIIHAWRRRRYCRRGRCRREFRADLCQALRLRGC